MPQILSSKEASEIPCIVKARLFEGRHRIARSLIQPLFLGSLAEHSLLRRESRSKVSQVTLITAIGLNFFTFSLRTTIIHLKSALQFIYLSDKVLILAHFVDQYLHQLLVLCKLRMDCLYVLFQLGYHRTVNLPLLLMALLHSNHQLILVALVSRVIYAMIAP